MPVPVTALVPARAVEAATMDRTDREVAVEVDGDSGDSSSFYSGVEFWA
jgi:hypothetical protein